MAWFHRPVYLSLCFGLTAMFAYIMVTQGEPMLVYPILVGSLVGAVVGFVAGKYENRRKKGGK